MGEFVYRFRKIDDLLGPHQELERQEIYFAPVHELNDPMEGHREVVWQGDEILWRNLLRHYVRAFVVAMGMAVILGEDEPQSEILRLTMIAVTNPPEAPIRDHMQTVAAAFMARPAIGKLAACLAARSRPTRRLELLAILRIVHFLAIHEASEHSVATGHPRILAVLDADTIRAVEENIENLTKHPALPADLAEGVWGGNETFNMQMEVIGRASGAPPADKAAFLVRDFPARYVEALIDMTYPSSQIACFVEEPDNAALWSGYAANQTGVCLKFRTSETADGGRALTLDSGRSWRTSEAGIVEGRHDVPVRFEPVIYDAAYPEIPFFTSLGQLTHSTLNRLWYTEDGVASPVVKDVKSHEKAWRESYWARLAAGLTRKTRHWSYEQEIRLYLTDFSSPRETLDSRLMHYRFDDLVGIIFGVRTSTEDKARIFRVIDAKCRAVGRTEFEFLQADYSSEGIVVTKPLGHLKVGVLPPDPSVVAA